MIMACYWDDYDMFFGLLWYVIGIIMVCYWDVGMILS